MTPAAYSPAPLAEELPVVRGAWAPGPAVDSFQGRHAELATLRRWLGPEQHRLVVLLGMGGVGKTALAAKVVTLATSQFDYISWVSLLNAPPLAEVLADWLYELSQHTLKALPGTLAEQLRLLLDYLRQRRCLLVLDNLESLLQPSLSAAAGVGRLNPAYAAYGELLQRLCTSDHRSTLLLTSRELPQGLMRWSGQSPALQTLQLAGLDVEASQLILQSHGLAPSPQDTATLVQHYSGNPLALQIVATTIADFYAGDVRAFYQGGIPIFDDIRTVLDQQFARLSDRQRELLFWLATEREPVTAPVLFRNLVQAEEQSSFLESLRALQQRSLLLQEGEGFTLQNVII